MTVKWMSAVAAGALVMSGAGAAGEFAVWCVASAPEGAENIEDICSCLEEATEGDEDARASMIDVGDIEDRQERFAAMSADAQDAVSSCRP